MGCHGFDCTAVLNGVFCHGSPQVSFTDAAGTSRRCELADLLIVVDDCTGTAVSDRRALLVQAKLFSSAGTISTSGTAAHQLDLYSRWPSFTFTSSAYKATSRDFAASGPGLVGESGRYGGIDLSPRPVVWEHIIPSSSMTAGTGTQLADFLSEMVIGSTAFGREATPGGSDDWSSTVDELLSVTAAQTVSLAASLSGGSRPRGASATASMFIDSMISALGAAVPHTGLRGSADVPPSTVGPRETGPDGGISVLRIAIERSEEREG